MELDDIKKIMQTNDLKEGLSEEAFRKMKARKSLHPAEKIRRKVLYENLIGLSLGIIIIVLLWIFNSEIPSIIDISSILIITTSLIYGFWKLNQMQRILKYTDNTKSFLKKFKQSIEAYIKILTISGLIVFPIGYYLGLTLSYTSKSGIEFINIVEEFIEKPKLFILETVFAVILTICVYYLIKFVYQKLYGKHIKEIEQLLIEIE